MRILPILSLLSILPLLSPAVVAQTTGAPPPLPSDFDPSAPLPKNVSLPGKLDIPINTRIEVTSSRKKQLPFKSQPNDPRLLWDPDLESAVIERNQQDAHVVFQWEGGRSSEAFIIHGLCFRILSLSYPDMVSMTGPALDFWVNRTDPSEGAGGDFPGVSWYTPSSYAGKASLDGSTVLVFTPGEKKSRTDNTPGATAYPEGPSLCLDVKTLLPVWLTDGQCIFSFTYIPAPNVQINPQGPYLKAIQNKFGHYP